MLQELSQLCNVIVEPLRDRIVTSLLQAALVCAFAFLHIYYKKTFSLILFTFFFFFIISQDGLLRVLLDGGPSRVFSTSDAKMFEEDLEVLKVLSLWSLNI